MPRRSRVHPHEGRQQTAGTPADTSSRPAHGRRRPPAEVTCWLCGDALHLVADDTADEYAWVDANGGRFAIDRDLRDICGGNPYMRLQQLADRLRSRRGQVTPASDRDVREYAALNVRVQAGTFHQHHPTHTPPYDGQRFRHCDYPGWLRPSGWHCRICHTRMTDRPDGWVQVPAADGGSPPPSTAA
jgi:hypothetical protein